MLRRLAAGGSVAPHSFAVLSVTVKEWLTVAVGSTLDWLPLAHEAREFVASGRR